ncbi:hypothetical protein HGRIS_014632 [Hohenbuehelia grisea]|uniref:Peroxisomal multifunctional enzyme type 2-like N-terminal domain-containing protein n=1 Tax=Hohenbuehelia grisea TaxID=104357 RepID=A0ABR3JUQ0_9AGAR
MVPWVGVRVSSAPCHPHDHRNSSPALSSVLHAPPSTFSALKQSQRPEGRNQRIKKFHWRLWYGDNVVLPNIDVHEKFVGPEGRIDVDNVERFCAVVGNQGESFKKSRTADVKAPMDFAIVIGWQTIMKSIFLSAINSNFFKLVHGFRMVECARPLQVGDVCRAEARIVSVANANEGKIIKVKGHVYRDGQPVITVVSTLLYRGGFVDFENTFEILISNQLKRRVKVDSVDFQQDDSHGNPVLPYLQRHGAPQRLPTPLAHEGYTLTSKGVSTSFNAPLTNEPCSNVLGDFNPIHTNPYFSDYASLPCDDHARSVFQRCNQALCQERCCSRPPLA